MKWDAAVPFCVAVIVIAFGTSGAFAQVADFQDCPRHDGENAANCSKCAAEFGDADCQSAKGYLQDYFAQRGIPPRLEGLDDPSEMSCDMAKLCARARGWKDAFTLRWEADAKRREEERKRRRAQRAVDDVGEHFASARQDPGNAADHMRAGIDAMATALRNGDIPPEHEEVWRDRMNSVEEWLNEQLKRRDEQEQQLAENIAHVTDGVRQETEKMRDLVANDVSITVSAEKLRGMAAAAQASSQEAERQAAAAQDNSLSRLASAFESLGEAASERASLLESIADRRDEYEREVDRKIAEEAVPSLLSKAEEIRRLTEKEQARAAAGDVYSNPAEASAFADDMRMKAQFADNAAVEAARHGKHELVSAFHEFSSAARERADHLTAVAQAANASPVAPAPSTVASAASPSVDTAELGSTGHRGSSSGSWDALLGSTSAATGGTEVAPPREAGQEAASARQAHSWNDLLGPNDTRRGSPIAAPSDGGVEVDADGIMRQFFEDVVEYEAEADLDKPTIGGAALDRAAAGAAETLAGVGAEVLKAASPKYSSPEVQAVADSAIDAAVHAPMQSTVLDRIKNLMQPVDRTVKLIERIGARIDSMLKGEGDPDRALAPNR